MKPEDRPLARRLAARNFIALVLRDFRKQFDVISWRAEGGDEFQALVHALDTGGMHAMLGYWEDLKATTAAGRPTADLLDLRGRRGVELLVEALVSNGAGKGKARKQAAAAVKEIFPTTPDAIRNWQSASPPLSAEEKKLIEGAIRQCNHDPRRLTGWFLHLIRFGLDPSAAWTARRILIKKDPEKPDC